MTDAIQLQFDTASREFCRGAEVGRLWAMLRVDRGRRLELVHAENLEMIWRLAESTGRTVRELPPEEVDEMNLELEAVLYDGEVMVVEFA